ncbi:LysR family transcriptional regulator [Parvularcula lutaonensis]|uniref:LysR family transcriptional regulator n=1 Tax=Parvularcula lutaonensis TaxID=491923 RepID=A0ABV7M878_9PROT|nr:LysR family transcriptional regulator [Parvularcula lutaonensis]GGY56796.1 LysR family transcriptional regulator [Parvularcula lutaonensis]
MTTLNYHHLRYFWAVAHDGNLTRTAQKLNVSQSALSFQIKKLEERLGQKLFERKGKQLVLTEAGAIALDHADVIFSTGEELLDTLLQRNESQAKILRVGALSTLSRNFQMQFLRPLIGEEDIFLSIRSGSLDELVSLLIAQKLDVALTDQIPARTGESPWIVHPLAEQQVSLVAPAGFRRGRRSLERLLSEERLIVPSKDSSIRIGFDGLVERLGIKPNIFAEVDDMALLRVLAREEVALAVVPPIVVKDELASGRLIDVLDLPGLTEAFYAITMSRRFPNPALRMVMQKAADQDKDALGKA